MYYVLGRNTKPRRWVDNEPFIKGVSFWRGAKIVKDFELPLAYELQPLNPDAAEDAPYMPSTLAVKIPLFRTDLLEALERAGVQNLDCYDAIVKDPDDGTVHTNYKAVNILGLVGAADMAKSVATVHDGGPLIDVDFDKLVVDEKKARGLLFFRLAESTNAIMVAESVRDHLLKSGFDDLEFYKPNEVAL